MQSIGEVIQGLSADQIARVANKMRMEVARINTGPGDFSVSFRIDGVQPLPKQSTRFANGHTYTEKRITAWQEEVAIMAKEAMSGCDPHPGPVMIEVWFYRKDRTRVDTDNLIKAVKDGMNGIVWKDDSQVIESHLHKMVCRKNPGIKVWVHSASFDDEVTDW